MSESTTIPYRPVLPLDRGGPFEVWRIEPIVEGRTEADRNVVPVPGWLAGPPLALKCLAPDVRDADHASEVLRREARLQGRIRHPGVVPVELVELGERPAVVSPLAWGALGSLPQGRGGWSLLEIVRSIRRLADALALLHAAGIVHGDVAPTNVLLFDAESAGPPVMALTDFGCAVEAGESGSARGTPGAVAPEVDAGECPGTAADVYGLGRVGQALLAAADIDDSSPARVALEAWCSTLTDPDPRRRPSASLAAATVPTRTRVRTVEFGPRPCPPEALDSARHRAGWRSRVGLALLGVLAISIVGGLVAKTGSRQEQGCARTGRPVVLRPDVPRRLDVLGTGCAQQVTWSGTVLTVRTDRYLRRYRLGRPGDVLAIGTWGCFGKPRPVLYRPGSGEILDYPRLPTRLGSAGATPPTRRIGLVADGRARLARNPHGCLRLVVTRRDPPTPPDR